MRGLKNSEQLLRYSQTLSKTGSWEWNISTNEQQWSEELFRIHGIPVTDKVPDTEEYMRLIHPDDRADVMNAISDSIAANGKYKVEYRIITSNLPALKFMRSFGEVITNELNQKVFIGCSQDITELVIAERSKRESENMLDTVFNSLPLMLMVIDRDINVLKVNRLEAFNRNNSSAEGLALKPGDVINCINALNSEFGCTTGKDCNACILRQSIKETIDYKVEHKNKSVSITLNRNGNNEVLHVLLSTKVLDPNSGRILISIDDITPRIKIEKALNESETRFKVLYNKSVDAIFISEVETALIVDVNDTACKRFKYTRDELIGMTIPDLHAPETRHSFTEKYKKNSTSTAGRLIIEPEEHILLTKFGEHVIVEYLAETVIINARPYMMGIFRDISRRKTSEQQLKEAQRIANIGSWYFDMASQNAGWSDMMYTITGISRDCDNLLEAMRQIVHPEDKVKFNMALQALLMSGGHFKKMDFRIINQQTKRIRFVQAESKQYYDKHNKLISISGTIQDITDQKLIEQDLIKAKEHAEESDRLKSAFIANMSHEIRTPMNGIVGFTDLLMEDPDTPEIAKYASIIQNSSMQLLSIVNDILDISSIETGQMKILKESLDIESLINEIYEFHLPKISGKGISFEKHLNPCPGQLISDGIKIRQILNNLINNAYKFTDSGSISISCHPTATEINISVEDTGIGIPPSYYDQIFERFTQVQSKHNQMKGGTGLGLAISKHLSKLLGGDLNLDKNRAIGSSFTLTLPLD